MIVPPDAAQVGKHMVTIFAKSVSANDLRPHPHSANLSAKSLKADR